MSAMPVRLAAVPAISAWDTARDLLARDLRLRAAPPTTTRAYLSDVDDLARWATARALEPPELTFRQVRAYLADLTERELSPATVHRRLAAVRRLCGVLVDDGVLEHNPAELVQPPRRRRRLPRVLSQQEARELLERVDGSLPLELRDRALLALAYGSGLRAAELVGVNVEDVAFDAGELRVTRGKGAKDRVVPVAAPALSAIDRYLRDGRPDTDCPALLVTESGRRLQTSDVRRRVELWARRAGLHGVSPHSLRHSCGAHLLEGGASLRAIQLILGHEKLSTTQLYTQLEPSRLRDSYRRHHPRA